MKTEQNEKKKPSGLFSMLFGKKQALSVLEEEAMQSQWKAAITRLLSVPMNVVAIVIFLSIFFFMMIGTRIFPFEESYQDVTQQNVSPGYNLMSVPKEIIGNIRQISVGSTFSAACTNDGRVVVWGKTRISKTIDVGEIPEKMGNVVMVAAGYDHIIAVNDKNQVFCWGNKRLKQCDVPATLNGRKKVIHIAAGHQGSFAVTEDGKFHFWGNESMLNVKVGDYQGRIVKAEFTFSGVVALLNDGTMAILGNAETAYSKIPSGLNNVIDFATTSNSVSAITSDGRIVTWGSTEKNLAIPLTENDVHGKPIAIGGGRYHFTVLTDTGYVYSWGYNNFRQSDAPNITDAVSIGVGYFQNYAITSTGKVETWGLHGYLMGSDGYGRDVFTRIIGGGRMTLTIGAVAVVISTTIGILLGSIAGFFGGRMDMLIMRFQEIVSSIPFLPLAMILSVVVGARISETNRIFLIMVILGILSWTGLCRLVRAQVLAEREKEYIIAGKAMGVSELALIFRHIFPNIISVIIVNATLSFAACLLTESGLSYLGFGVVEPKPTWGNMLNGCNDSVVIQNYWWRWVFPAIALGLCTICINIIGDGLRDAMDPRTAER